jgi:hypothetical protein
LKAPGKDMEFEINFGNVFLHPVIADCHATFEVVGRDAGGDFKEAECFLLLYSITFLAVC